MKNEILDDDEVFVIDSHRSQRFYERLRKRAVKWLASNKRDKYANIILLAPDLFVLLTRLMLDKRVAVRDRAIVAGAVLYFMTPVDIIPDIFFPVGMVDDVMVAVIALNNIVLRTDQKILREHWEGDADILDVLQRISSQASSLLGNKTIEKLRNALTKSTPKE